VPVVVEVLMALLLTSGAFPAGGGIPARYTCDGTDVSPALAWSGTPAGTAAFALLVDDPDAPGGTWVHWVLFNLPGTLTALPEGVPGTDAPRGLGGALQGRNDFRKVGYGGPCPPAGPAHRYFFRLYALDAALPLRAGAERGDVERAMRGHVLAETTLMGTYARRRR
jgi:Raf kinase inhibitor-like YbhB/YbcL family protein